MNHYIPFLIVAAIILVIILLPLAKAGVEALAAFRERQKSAAARVALDLVTAGVATLVARVEIEVRDLKDPLKPGAWRPAVDGPKMLARVIDDYWRLGTASWAKYRAVEGLNFTSASKLLADIAHQQLLLLRTAPAPALPPVAEVVLDVVARAEVPAAVVAAEVTRALESSPANSQSGRVDVRTLLAIASGVMAALCVVAALAFALAPAGCLPVQRLVLDHTDGVPARGPCVPRTQRCARTDAGVFVTLTCSDERREWPSMPLRPDGSERTCAAGEGCEVTDAGIARCIPAADGGAR